jgi:lipoprotein-releasing system permease protein
VTAWWLAFKYFGSWRRFFTLTTLLAILGMAIGVASLVVSMAVFSGYVTTLEKTVQDAVGHVLVLKRGTGNQEEMLKDILPLVPGLLGKTPFVYAEAILAHKGKISGILIEGVDEGTVGSVLNLKNRVVSGEMDFTPSSKGLPKIMIGKEIAQRFDVKVGDVLNLVVPLAVEYQATNFRPKLSKFEVAGIIHYGRYDFDSRYVVMPLAQAQEFVEIGQRITGYRLKLNDPFRARAVVQEISSKFGQTYWARDWLEVNRNLFEAVRLEKTVLFFVLMILVVAAAFNIANVLFISVVQRYRDISVLKTLGAPNVMIRRIFICQGLIVGAMGAFSGIVAGLLLCRIFEWAQTHYPLIPAEVYKLDHINLRVQATDLLAIVGVSLAICFVATLVPSRRGARISPVEGLRYE